MKYKGFSYADGRMTNIAYLDGYDFGDRLLEGVAFKCEVNEDGTLTVGFAFPKGKYEKGLNQKHWVKMAQGYAAQHDIFCETDKLRGEDLALEVLTEEE